MILMTDKKVLLLISTTCKSDKTESKALDIARRDQAELLILFILDDELSEHIVDQMTQEGWFGGRTTDELHTFILKEYFTHGNRRIKEIEDLAREQNIPVHSASARGDFVDVALEFIHQEKPDLIIATRCRRSHLSNFIFSSPAAKLQKKANTEIMIIDE
jgi:nucleotide-binding universal stress UspA family protein